MRNMADLMNIPFKFDEIINPSVFDNPLDVDMKLTIDDILKLDLNDIGRQKNMELALKMDQPNWEYIFACAAGINYFWVNPAGELCLCSLFRQNSIDLKKVSFQKAWNELIPPIRFRNTETDSACHNCNLIHLCGWCPAWASLCCGDCYSSVAYLCEIAKARACSYNQNNERR